MVRLRPAAIEDAHAISTIRIETWRAAYRGLIDDRILDGLDVDRDTDTRREVWQSRHADPRGIEVVAVDGDDVLGWGAAGPSRHDDMRDHGEVYALYVLQRRWSTGAGHALLIELERSLREAGFEHAMLHVLDGNERAARFYERHGWREDGTSMRDDRFAGGLDVPAIVERRRIRDLGETVAG